MKLILLLIIIVAPALASADVKNKTNSAQIELIPTNPEVEEGVELTHLIGRVAGDCCEVEAVETFALSSKTILSTEKIAQAVLSVVSEQTKEGLQQYWGCKLSNGTTMSASKCLSAMLKAEIEPGKDYSMDSITPILTDLDGARQTLQQIYADKNMPYDAQEDLKKVFVLAEFIEELKADSNLKTSVETFQYQSVESSTSIYVRFSKDKKSAVVILVYSNSGA